MKVKAPGFFDWFFAPKPTKVIKTQISEDDLIDEPTETLTLKPTITETPELTETPEPTPDYSWIEPYVATVINELDGFGYDFEVINAFADTLRDCLRSAVVDGKSAVAAQNNCQGSIDKFKKSPTPTPEIRKFGGSWHSSVLCGENDEPKYTWVVNLSQSSNGKVTGTIDFHNCPGGGAAFYSVTGQAAGDPVLVLSGSKTGGRGGLGGSAPGNVQFTIRYKGAPNPDLTR